MGRALAERGFATARFAVLANLKFHGAYNVGALAAALQVSRPAMTRLVRDMEVAGLVERSPDERDGRDQLARNGHVDCGCPDERGSRSPGQ